MPQALALLAAFAHPRRRFGLGGDPGAAWVVRGRRRGGVGVRGTTGGRPGIGGLAVLGGAGLLWPVLGCSACLLDWAGWGIAGAAGSPISVGL